MRYADLRLDVGRARLLAVREDHTGPGSRSHRSSPSRSTATGAPVVLVDGPGLHGRAPPVAGRDAARLARVGPPGHALGCDPAARRPVRRRWHAGRIGARRRRPRRVDRPARVVARRRPPLRVGPDRLVEPLPPRRRAVARAARADGRRVRRSGLGLRAVVVRVHGRRLDRGDCAEGGPRSTCSTSCLAGSIGEVVSPFTEFEGLVVRPTTIVAVVGSPSEPSRWSPVRPDDARPGRRPSSLDRWPLPTRRSSRRRSRSSSRSRQRSHRPCALLRAAEPALPGTDGERPPLVVVSHGGPTVQRLVGSRPDDPALTSRGIAVVDVDYGGSSGYGRAYRRELDGQWGIVDVDDCVAAAQLPRRARRRRPRAAGDRGWQCRRLHDARRARVPRRVRGRHQPLRHRRPRDARRDTHKFESRYMDRLVGPYPEMADVYRERSPIHFLDRISCPVLVMQGLEDRVVPPSQAESLVAALTARDIPCAYLAFAGEGHGFRGADADPPLARCRDRVPRRRSSGSSRPIPWSLSTMPGLDAWRQRRLGASATPGEAWDRPNRRTGPPRPRSRPTSPATQPTSPERDTGDKDAPEAKEELAARRARPTKNRPRRWRPQNDPGGVECRRRNPTRLRRQKHTPRHRPWHPSDRSAGGPQSHRRARLTRHRPPTDVLGSHPAGPRPLRRGRGTGVHRPPDRRGLPDPARPRRARPRVSCPASRRSRSLRTSSSCCFLPPILFGAGYFDADPRLQGERAADRAARRRSRAVHDGRGRARHEGAGPRYAAGGRVRARRDRGSTRCRRRDRRSSAASASRVGSSRSSRVKASSTTPRH